ncbi:membrane or secreted protein [Aequorivita sp. H23M31]|uniref:Membrane or secreted protein n=1 Tax=Aequorivita ciconiae TaxID=2494375 RepID=A0A410G0E5_9FLAO|nr:membrane or secreted protein [Aequorivita sp. H23M31]QAA80744.1 membrane or secreted protein [Aequorivita sp. H23M31]
MTKTILFLVCTFLSLGINAQSIIGAWEGAHTSEERGNLKSVLIVSEKHQSIAVYDADTGAFVSTNGGSWKLDGNTMTETVEFDSANPENVGREFSFEISLKDSTLEIPAMGITLKRIDDNTPGVLHGAWLMSGRNIEGKTELRDTDTPRKTMKILSGTRFQWIAYNTETKQFMATGGGTYTTEDGIYTENIEFFSRDNSRVGLQLQFDYEVQNGNWHHTGLSSKGDPIDEFWSPRK